MWTFDLDSDTLQFDKRDQNWIVPLHLVREHGLTLSDFNVYDPVSVATGALQYCLRLANGGPTYQSGSRSSVDHRRMAFVRKVLKDFASQWRYTLCKPYSETTFRRFAYGIVRIISLDFQVAEIELHASYKTQFHPHHMPSWNNPGNYQTIVRTEGATIAICQHPMISTQMDEFDRSKPQAHTQITSNLPENKLKPQLNYLMLTVREAIRFDLDRAQYHLRPTESNIKDATFRLPDSYKGVYLLDSNHELTDEAVEFLLDAIQPLKDTQNRINKLPLELQDEILNQVPDPIERTRLGCILNAGTEFKWKNQGTDIKLIDSEVDDSKPRLVTTIYFDHRPNLSSRLVYQN